MQSGFALNREVLLSKGIYFPKGGNREMDMLNGKVSPGNGKWLFVAMKNDDYSFIKERFQELKDKLIEKQSDKLLVSNEQLIELLSERARLKKFESIVEELGFEIDYLIVLRHPQDQILSLYKHRMKSLRFISLDDWFNDYKLINNLYKIRDQMALDSESFTFIAYKENGLEMIEDIFEFWFEIPLCGFWENIRVNKSPSLSELRFLGKIGNEQVRKYLYENFLEISNKGNDKAYDNKLLNDIYDKIERDCALFKDLDERLINVSGYLVLYKVDGVDVCDDYIFSADQIALITKVIQDKKHIIRIKNFLIKVKVGLKRRMFIFSK
ncbi:MAG: hypothetical protein JXQ87_03455 [Bacteroidia bacterium]